MHLPSWHRNWSSRHAVNAVIITFINYVHLLTYYLPKQLPSSPLPLFTASSTTALHYENTTISETDLIATICFMSRPSSMKSSIVLCCNINKLTYLLTASWPHLSLNWLYFRCSNVIPRCIYWLLFLLHFILISYRPAKRAGFLVHTETILWTRRASLEIVPLGQVIIKGVAVVELGLNNGSGDDGSCFGK